MSTVTITEEEFYRLKEKAGETSKPDPEQCRENGHVWKFVGGANAGCCDDCACSTSVHQCIICNVCDYGENEETEVIIANCADREEMEFQRQQEDAAAQTTLAEQS